MEQIKELWEKKQVRMVAMGAVALIVMYFMADVFFQDAPKRTYQNIEKPQSVLGISDSLNAIADNEMKEIFDTYKVEIDQKSEELNARELNMKKQNEAMTKQIMNFQNQLFEIKEQMKAITDLNNKLNGSAEGLPVQKGQVQGDKQFVDVIDKQTGVFRRPQTNIVTTAPPITTSGTMIRTVTQRAVRSIKESGIIEEKEVEINRLNERGQSVTRDGKPINTDSDIVSQNNAETGDFALSMGSIITGTTINGVAAPTGIGSSDSPIPIMMRVKKEAVMPNYYTLDIKDCHILGSAIGNLASERVMIRAEAISCITESGGAIEKNIVAYAVSSTDGMAGVRGELVTRSGAMIANTLTAGFISGFADAASPSQITSLNTSPSSSTIWQSQNLDRYTGAGMLKGASNAANRLADYYMALVDQTWPVVELLPGIQIDFLVQKGMTLKLNSSDQQSIGVNNG